MALALPLLNVSTTRFDIMATVNASLAGEHEMLQPPHWLAEVGAVLARSSPNTAGEDVVALRALELPVTDDAQVRRRATRLAIDLKQHLFDRLYHAVAVETNAILAAADDHYRRKARGVGCVRSVHGWRQ